MHGAYKKVHKGNDVHQQHLISHWTLSLRNIKSLSEGEKTDFFIISYYPYAAFRLV